MLQIEVNGTQLWDEEKEQFVSTDSTVIRLEHSLVSISKWESIYKRPYLVPQRFSQKETVDYIKCMCLDDNISDEVFFAVYGDSSLMKQIDDYINSSPTATTINDNDKKKRNSEKITSELIYYWMVANEIPFTCETWHIERLLTLIRVCNVKNQPPKKQSSKDIYARNKQLNAARRAKHHSKG